MTRRPLPRPVPAAARLLRWVVRPFQVFFETESAGGLVLVFTAALAVAWANSPWHAHYRAVFDAELSVGLGPYRVSWPLLHWVNEVLMTVFFLVVGMEIKRELVTGELRTVRRALLPLVSAAGGMAAPALIFSAINRGGPGASGWGIPTATDIAFSLGCLSLLGRRVPSSLSVFLAALAIFDDLGAILLIAAFYGGSIKLVPLGISVGLLLLLVGMGRLSVQRPWPYLVLGAALWGALFATGVHPTLAGVALGLAIPARARRTADQALADLEGDLGALRRAASGEQDDGSGALSSLEQHLEGLQAPVSRLIRSLHPWVAFGIVPLFALGNAGVRVSGADLSGGGQAVAVGVLAGLAAGKTAGVFGATFAAVKLGLCPRPEGASWAQLLGVSTLAGIGFTMSVFIAGLAFPHAPALADAAKVGILAGSIGCAVVGSIGLRLVSRG